MIRLRPIAAGIALLAAGGCNTVSGTNRSQLNVLSPAEEHRLGRIKVGYCADLTAYAEDPAECPAEDLPANPCVLTMVDGEVVHRG